MTGNKNDRITFLKEVIENFPLVTQTELSKMLSKKGYRVTQASISRDLQEIGARKKDGRYFLEKVIGNGGWLDAAILSVEKVGENLVVIKTASGAANYVAEVIDQEGWDGVAGTVAGDNTIFVAVHTAKAASAVMKKCKVQS